MITFISILAIFFAVIAAFTPMFPALIPRIGLLPVYRMRLVRAIFIVSAWALAITASLSTPPSFFALPFVLLLSIPTLVLKPQRIFISLDDPEHLPSPQANFQGEALVLGYEDGEHALAWPFETLSPRHLINDKSGETPLLVAY